MIRDLDRRANNAAHASLSYSPGYIGRLAAKQDRQCDAVPRYAPEWILRSRLSPLVVLWSAGPL